MGSAPDDADYVIEPLGRQHDRATFSSGVDELDRYFHKYAQQDARKRVAAPFVLVVPGSTAVAGYYTLAATGIRLGDMPAAIARKLRKYPIVPATLLGRLAVDQRHRGTGFGELLLIDALHRSARMSTEIASMAIVVDAKDERARTFYLHYHFLAFPEQTSRLFLPMKTVDRLFV